MYMYIYMLPPLMYPRFVLQSCAKAHMRFPLLTLLVW